MLRNGLILAAITLVVMGCASKSDGIRASKVSPTLYANYECDGLAQEYVKLIQRSNQIQRRQNEIADGDNDALTIGLVLFWPALFFVGDDDLEYEVAQLKGEVNAMEQASVMKGCTSLLQQLSSDQTSSSGSNIADKDAADRCKGLGFQEGSKLFNECKMTYKGLM